jgi:hypothetical protein
MPTDERKVASREQRRWGLAQRKPPKDGKHACTPAQPTAPAAVGRRQPAAMRSYAIRALALVLLCIASTAPSVEAKRRLHTHSRGKQQSAVRPDSDWPAIFR